jgi:3'(2'), 5'-bisphosphate nucleotidase
MQETVVLIQNNLSNLLTLALDAGKAILEVYETAFFVELKDDRSPLTLADKRSNEILYNGLINIGARPHDQLGQGFPIMSEEIKQLPYEERKSWNIFWLVDPLDGTKEFIKRNGEFTVNIALIEGNEPVFGLIYVPVTKQFYYAIKGHGSYSFSLTDSNAIPDDFNGIIAESEKLPTEHRSEGEYNIVASRSHMSPQTETYINAEKGKHKVVNIVSAGSSLKFCLVAEGKADAYPRFGPTMEWDTGAGHIIVTETGKKLVRTDTMEPLTYNKENLLNPDFLVY